MTSKAFLICVVVLVVDVVFSANPQNKIGSKVLSRRKRFVIFPTGSSFSVAVCMTIGGKITKVLCVFMNFVMFFLVYGNPQFSIFSWALNYGFAYNLPSNSSYFLHPPEGILDFPFFKDDTSTTTTTSAPETTIIAEHEHGHEHEHGAHSDSSLRRQYPNYNQLKFETKPMMQRRYRRDIYRNIESLIDR